MRTTTLTRAFRVALILAGLAVLPQFASAQLPIETRQLKLQASTGTDGAVTLSATSITTPYTLNFPATGSPGKGAFLFMTNSSGDYKWTNAPSNEQTTLYWDGTNVSWVDPNGASNPNWSRAGNDISSTGTLGSTSNFGFNIITNNKIRIGFANDGAITVNTTTDGGATTTIGRAAGHTTAIDGTTNITGATTIAGATDINVGASTSATNVGTGTNAGTVTVGRTGGTLTTIGSLGHTGTADITGATTVLGITNINATGGATTNIATTDDATVAIGNIGGTNTIVGATTINATGTDVTSIGTAAGAGTVTIGRTSGTLTTIGSLGHTGTASVTGATTVVGATNLNATGTAATNIGTSTDGTTVTIGHSAATLTSSGTFGHTGSLSLVGANSELNMDTDAGQNGYVLVSGGDGVTPSWKSLNDATGIKASGKITFTNATTGTPAAISTLEPNDKVLITVEGSSGVVAQVSAIDSASSNTFTVTTSSTFTGTVHYLVLD